jgi:hypothetical protein
MKGKTPLIPHVPGMIAAMTAVDEEVLEDVALAAAEAGLAADPRAKLGELGFALADDAAAELLPTGAAAAEEVATADVGTMRVAVELTPGMLVPEGMSTMAEVEVAFNAACAMAIWLFVRS